MRFTKMTDYKTYKYWFTAGGHRYVMAYCYKYPRQGLDRIREYLQKHNLLDFKLWAVNQYDDDGTIYTLYFVAENCPFSYVKNY